jgi:hypothetical protein
MSEFEMDFGQELIEIIAKKLMDGELLEENGVDTNKNIRAFIRDFADWSEVVLDDDSDDSDYIEVEDTLSESSSSEEEDPDIPKTIKVNEIYETEVDENGFHRLKDVILEEEK